MSRTSHKVRTNIPLIKSWWGVLRSHPQILAFVRRAGLAACLDALPSEQGTFPFLALCERWWNDTNSIHVPSYELTLTPLDFFMLTGIRIGLGDPLPWRSDYSFSDVQRLLGPLSSFLEFHGYGIKGESLRRVYSSLPLDDLSDVEVTFVTRSFLLYTFSHLFFSNANSVVKLGYLACLEDLSALDSFDWGSSILAFSYISLASIARYGAASIYGFWTLWVVSASLALCF